MKKIEVGNYTLFVDENLQGEELQKFIDERIKYLQFRRQLMLRKSDGTVSGLGQGVRKHGKRHTS